MDVGLVVAPTRAPAAAPAAAAGAAAAPGGRAGFGAALARTLGAQVAKAAPPPGASSPVPAGGTGSTAEPERPTGATPSDATSSQTKMGAEVRVPVYHAPEGPDHDVQDAAPAPTEAAAAEPVHEGEPEPAPRITATPAPAAAATARVERSLERLAPEFRTRLERVIDRMEGELGLEVRVVETFRTQERQDALFEQGRTEAGPRVTWTRRSNHTLGRAADLRVEGTDATRGYAQLARIAQEEGLRTLGPSDPGHVEMPNGRATTKPESAPAPRRIHTTHAVPRVAEPAQVAHVAQVAWVAQVASPGSTQRTYPTTPALPADAVSRAGAPMAGAPPQELAVPTLEAPEVGRAERAVRKERPVVAQASALDRPVAARHGEPALRRDVAAHARVAAAYGSAEPRTDPERPRTRPEPATDAAPVRTDTLAASGSVERPASSHPAAPAAPVQRNDIAGRVARLLALQDATATAPTTGMTLMLDGVDGAAARIRLGVRGNAVGATIDVADAVEAAKLGERIGELTRALERQGLEPATVTVRDVPGLRDAADATRVVATSMAVGATDVGAGTKSSDSGQDRPSGQHRRDPGTAEDRHSRRNPKEGQK